MSLLYLQVQDIKESHKFYTNHIFIRIQAYLLSFKHHHIITINVSIWCLCNNTVILQQSSYSTKADAHLNVVNKAPTNLKSGFWQNKEFPHICSLAIGFYSILHCSFVGQWPKFPKVNLSTKQEEKTWVQYQNVWSKTFHTQISQIRVARNPKYAKTRGDFWKWN
jgi:hypothetical protein